MIIQNTLLHHLSAVVSHYYIYWGGWRSCEWQAENVKKNHIRYESFNVDQQTVNQ